MSQPESSPPLTAAPSAESASSASRAPEISVSEIAAASEAPSDAPPSTASPEDGRRSGVPIWLFLLVCLAIGSAFVWQLRVAGLLESQVAVLEQDLRKKDALLGAHRGQLEEIRGGVSELASRLAGLQELVETDPERAVRIPGAAEARPRGASSRD